MANSIMDSGANWWEDDGDSASTSFGDEVEAVLPAGKVSLSGEFLDHDLLKLSAEISDIQTPVLGMAFHLKYDAGALSFLRYDPGEFLERGGDPFYLVMPVKDALAGETGKIIYGETLRRNDDFPVGNGNVAEFYFQQLDPSVGIYEFSFENGVVSTLDVVRQDISNIEFRGLSLDKNNSENVVLDGVDLGASVVGTDIGIGLAPVFILALAFSLLTIVIFAFLKMKKKKKFANFYL